MASDPWASFWRDEPAAQGGASLAGLPPATQAALDAPWSALSRDLRRRAKVLDLATGGGIVLDLLRRHRPDLQLTGVDAAATLPKRPGMVLKGGVPTESLPFQDGTFDAVTSRFGIEYGDLSRGAAEAVRVLRPGGMILFIVHHADSPVLRHNRSRLDALTWAARDSGWLDKAVNLARGRQMAMLPTPPAFLAAPNEGAGRFPGQPAAWEFLTGMVQVLQSSPPQGGATLAGLSELGRRVDGEIGRVQALMAAACDAARIEALRVALVGADVSIGRIDEPGSGAPLAWTVSGRKGDGR